MIDRQQDGRRTRPPLGSQRWLWASLAAACLLSQAPNRQALAGGSLAPPSVRRPVVLLVHGITIDPADRSRIFGKPREADGQVWTGLIGALGEEGLAFGGVIHPERGAVSLPLSLDTANTRFDVDTAPAAELFFLEFSPAANWDGVAARTLELASCVAELRRYTGCPKVRIVAHSAGGLVARAYLQSAFAQVAFRHDVDRLITISTPHLGSATADQLGHLLGTRAESLQTEAPLIDQLDDKLPLPPDVAYASIMVRAPEHTRFDSAAAYGRYGGVRLLDGLPGEFHDGGDQCVHVQSQNLRLAPVAAGYERSTGCPVQCLLVHAASRTDETVHEDALNEPRLQAWVRALLREDAACWGGFTCGQELGAWLDRQAAELAYGVIEREVLAARSFAELTGAPCKTNFVGRTAADAAGQEEWTYRFFTSEAGWRGRLLGIESGIMVVGGELRITCDGWGRIVHCQVCVEESRDATPADRFPGARQLCDRAWRRFAQGDFQAAREDFIALLRSEPRHANARRGLCDATNDLGAARLAREDFDTALDLFTQAIRYDPVWAVPLRNRAYATLKLAARCQAEGDSAGCEVRLEAALCDLDKAVALDEGHARGRALRGAVHERRGDLDAAIRDYHAARHGVSPSSAGQRGLVRCLRKRAREHEAQESFDQAAQDYQEALRLDPNGVASLNSLAWFLATCLAADLRDGPRAVELARRACERSGWSDAACLDTLAAACAEQGDYDQAVHWQEAALAAPSLSEQVTADELVQAHARLTLYLRRQPFRQARHIPSSATPSHAAATSTSVSRVD